MRSNPGEEGQSDLIKKVLVAIERKHPGMLESGLSALMQQLYEAGDRNQAVEVECLKGLLIHIRCDSSPLPEWAMTKIEELTT